MNISVESMESETHNVKCPRCWHWHGVIENFGHLPEEIEKNPELSQEKLCDGCQETILTDFPNHPSTPFIRECVENQLVKYSTKWYLFKRSCKLEIKKLFNFIVKMFTAKRSNT